MTMYRNCLYLSLLCWPLFTAVTTQLKNLPAESSIVVSNRDRRNQTIRDEFSRQTKRGLRPAYVITELAYRFYLSESTVESIVWNRGYYGKLEASQTAIAA